MKLFFSICFFCTFTISLSCFAQFQNLKEGDLLFQDGNCGDFCDAIKKVTSGYGDKDFSHNGLLMEELGEWYVLEAIGKGVSQTPLQDFLNRAVDQNGKAKVMVGRLDSSYIHLIPDAILAAKQLLGKPYDVAFDLDNDAYYCSELIHFAFKEANGGEHVFNPKPMTYKDPETDKIFPIWENYFKELGIPIPQGQLGLNPGGMSLEPIVTMFDLQ